MELLTPTHFSDYQLIDSGNFEKLERFGAYVLRRPEPQAVWDRHLPEQEWVRLTDAYFRKEKKGDGERGEWILRKGMPGQWFIAYEYKEMKLRMRLGLTAFKHVGIFPEQAANWNYIYDSIRSFQRNDLQVLNLFAYTGGASLAARAAGAHVTHVDSVKQVLTWSNENMQASNLADIRWMLDDAMKFVRREVRRGKVYNGIILDPPAYGRGPEGEKWVLEESISELVKLCGQLMPNTPAFFVLNLYSMGLSALVAENLARMAFPKIAEMQTGELYLPDQQQRKLPLSVFLRFSAI
jgi:23S rRNA (cytosine1962-C5)-methyltransferase